MVTLIYIGDPMCSWCWGIAPELEKLKDYCEDRQLEFQIKVGGLRPQGGDPWDQNIKDFLRHHWDQVHELSGQPFSYNLLELDHFNYHTEPACRMVVAARRWLGKGNLQWFKVLQKTFYVDALDINDIQNITPLCEAFKIDFPTFVEHAQSPQVKQATQQDFRETRQWGIQGYPSLVLMEGQKLTGISYGYNRYQVLRQRIEDYLSAKSAV